VIRRLSGEKTETSAVFHMITQFGGGKTHGLTLLYHLAKHGPAADKWSGVRRILEAAGISSIPLKITINGEVSPEGGVSTQKIEETKVALRELGLQDDVKTE